MIFRRISTRPTLTISTEICLTLVCSMTMGILDTDQVPRRTPMQATLTGTRPMGNIRLTTIRWLKSMRSPWASILTPILLMSLERHTAVRAQDRPPTRLLLSIPLDVLLMRGTLEMQEIHERHEIRETLEMHGTHEIHGVREIQETLEWVPHHEHRTILWPTTPIHVQEEPSDPLAKVPLGQKVAIAKRIFVRDHPLWVIQATLRMQALLGVIPRSASMDHGLGGHLTFGHGRSASSSNIPRMSHSSASAAAAAAAATATAGGSAGSMALPLTRRGSHAFGSESQLDQDRAGAAETRDSATSYAAAHPGPRRSDPSVYGAMIPSYGLRGAHAHAAAIAAASYYHVPPGYPTEAYPALFPGQAHPHGPAGQHGQLSRQEDKSLPGQSALSQSAGPVSGPTASMPVQAIPEHQQVSAA
ncbi:hypothetical protein BGX29_011703 [Mortierella sp. GBA35]|nr:hypothetical protein BGX29_011703 [Mortierella sp. GBA35]